MSNISFVLPSYESVQFALFALEEKIESMKSGDTMRKEYKQAQREFLLLKASLRIFNFADDVKSDLPSEV